MHTQTLTDFRSRLDGFSVGFLCTRMPEVGLTARPMRLLGHLKDDDRLWFASGLKSPKIADLSAYPEVCVTFQDGAKYASVSGTAEIVLAPDKAEALWDRRLRIWFPEGPRSEDLALVAVSIWSGELWDMHGIANSLRFAYQAGKAYLTGTALDPEKTGDHVRMQLQSAKA